MVFSSAIFLFYFLPIIFIFYFLTQGKLVLQNIVLFFASCVFYFWGEKQYTVLVLASVLFNYVMGVVVDRSRVPFKTFALALAIGVNLAILFWYKYLGFFINTLGGFASAAWHDRARGIHLPLGISFFTFHGLTYLIDIYRKDAKVSYNPLNVGLYTLFFPQLVAGPLVRYKDIDQQLRKRTVTGERLYEGSRRFIIGFAKKLLIANTAGEIADSIYGLPPHYLHASILWLAALSYALQIYFDFSGYSDMAIGLAKLFGFDFLENFNFPYAASSIKDFWRRWHISLSTFFRDYVYIPLGGNKKGKFRTYLNLLIVFFLTGIWHGASWNFVLWGLFHGAFLIVERIGFGNVLERLPRLLRHGYTLFVVLVGWVLFRIEDFGLLKMMLAKMFVFDATVNAQIYSVAYFLNNYDIFILIAGVFFSWPWFGKGPATPRRYGMAWKLGADLSYLLLFLVSLTVMSSSTFNPFIYFRF